MNVDAVDLKQVAFAIAVREKEKHIAGLHGNMLTIRQIRTAEGVIEMRSIIQTDREHCFLCGRNASYEPLDCHH